MRKEHKGGHSIGFVPTMGALHDGHISLVKESRKKRYCCLQHFCEPDQFNNKKDLERYPRNLDEDLEHVFSQQVAIMFSS